MILSYKYRFYPNKAQTEALNQSIFWCWRIWNDAVVQRQTYYKEHDKSLPWNDQQAYWYQVRRENPEFQMLPAETVASVVRRLKKSFSTYFALKKAGDKRARQPGEKPLRKYKSVEYRYGKGFIKFIPGDGARARLDIRNVGQLKVHYHRPIPNDAIIKHVVITNPKPEHWYVCFQIEQPDAEPPVHHGPAVGIDIGLCALLAFSDGHLEPNPRWYVEGQAKRSCYQQQLDRQRRANNPQNFNENGTAKEGVFIWHKSNRQRKVEAQHRKLEGHIAQQRWYYWHTMADKLTRAYSLIALEDLNLKFMLEGSTSLPAHDAAFAMFYQMLEYKAQRTGTRIVYVPPQHTSQRCHACGHTDSANRPTRGEFRCVACGHEDHADVNAAKNVLQLALE